MKKNDLLVATLAVGVIAGAISQYVPGDTPSTQVQAAPMWTDTEEAMLKRMNSFQERLDQLGKVRPDSVEALSKQIEAQRQIEDLLTKYREAKQAKFAPYVGAAGTLAAAIFGGIATWLGTWLLARIKPKSAPETKAV